jgi:tetratricopeptide (TPR) repeat protein
MMANPHAGDLARGNERVVPPPSPEQRRQASADFERANQVIANGDHREGIRLLLECCQLDPANLLYRQALRRTAKAWYRNKGRGSWLAWLTTWPSRRRLQAAFQNRDYLAVLEHGEQVLRRNPWEVGTQMVMAEAADLLGQLGLAIWLLEQARQQQPLRLDLNRSLAQLYEKRGNFSQALSLWGLIHKNHPDDLQAAAKVRDSTRQESPEAGQEPGPEPADREAETQEILELEKSIEEDPTRYEPFLELARRYRQQGRLSEAHAVLHQGLGPTGNAFDLIVELADVEIEPFRRDLALANEKLRDQPNDEHLQGISRLLGREVNARELDLLRLKVDRFPGDLSGRREFGLRLIQAGQFTEALAQIQVLLDQPRLPQRKELLYELARRFAEAGESRTALRFAEELAKLDPTHPDLNQLSVYWQIHHPQPHL